VADAARPEGIRLQQYRKRSLSCRTCAAPRARVEARRTPCNPCRKDSVRAMHRSGCLNYAANGSPTAPFESHQPRLTFDWQRRQPTAPMLAPRRRQLHSPFGISKARHMPPSERALQALKKTSSALGVQLDVGSSGTLQASLGQVLDSEQHLCLLSLCAKQMQLAKYFCIGSAKHPELRKSATRKRKDAKEAGERSIDLHYAAFTKSALLLLDCGVLTKPWTSCSPAARLVRRLYMDQQAPMLRKSPRSHLKRLHKGARQLSLHFKAATRPSHHLNAVAHVHHRGGRVQLPEQRRPHARLKLLLKPPSWRPGNRPSPCITGSAAAHSSSYAATPRGAARRTTSGSSRAPRRSIPADCSPGELTCLIWTASGVAPEALPTLSQHQGAPGARSAPHLVWRYPAARWLKKRQTLLERMAPNDLAASGRDSAVAMAAVDAAAPRPPSGVAESPAPSAAYDPTDSASSPAVLDGDMPSSSATSSIIISKQQQFMSKFGWQRRRRRRIFRDANSDWDDTFGYFRCAGRGGGGRGGEGGAQASPYGRVGKLPLLPPTLSLPVRPHAAAAVASQGFVVSTQTSRSSSVFCQCRHFSRSC
uniref:Protein kinase domain-containing protein n=1 Tax=Macrostomum lignano TaxID=282301 RepID=A0A1I8FMA3_9PLAT